MPITAPIVEQLPGNGGLDAIGVEPTFSDIDGNGPGNGGFDDSRYDPDRRPDPPVRPPALYRVAVIIGMAWITVFFATATVVLIDTWTNVTHWARVPLPHLLYLSTVLLLVSSWTMELARSWSGTATVDNCKRWMQATLLLGTSFLGTQIAAWMKVMDRSNHGGSQTPAFFFCLFTGTQAVCIFAGIVALAGLFFAARRWGRWRRKTAVSTMALFWHFAGVLWLYTLGLLLVSVGR